VRGFFRLAKLNNLLTED